MSHRDSFIKKNRELKKPLDLFNVGFVGGRAVPLSRYYQTSEGIVTSLQTDTGSFYDNYNIDYATGDEDKTTAAYFSIYIAVNQSGSIRVDFGSVAARTVYGKYGYFNYYTNQTMNCIVQSSNDASTWTTLYSDSLGNSSNYSITSQLNKNLSGTFRYLRFYVQTTGYNSGHTGFYLYALGKDSTILL